MVLLTHQVSQQQQQQNTSHYHYTKNKDGLFVCPHEGCTYAPQRLMQTMFYHLKKHEDALPFKCSVCKKEFLHKKTLENHQISQHADKKPAKEELFQCPIPGCGFASLTKGNCRIHILRIHMKTTVNDYLEREGSVWRCTGCAEEFTNSTGFYYHVADCLPERAVSAPAIRRGLGLPPLMNKSGPLLNEVDNRQEMVA